MRTIVKIIKAIYFIWVFANCYCLIDGISSRGGKVFEYTVNKTYEDEFGFDYTQDTTVYPSKDFKILFDENEKYDFTEFFVYVGTPAFLYFLIGYLRK